MRNGERWRDGEGSTRVQRRSVSGMARCPERRPVEAKGTPPKLSSEPCRVVAGPSSCAFSFGSEQTSLTVWCDTHTLCGKNILWLFFRTAHTSTHTRLYSGSREHSLSAAATAPASGPLTGSRLWSLSRLWAAGPAAPGGCTYGKRHAPHERLTRDPHTRPTAVLYRWIGLNRLLDAPGSSLGAANVLCAWQWGVACLWAGKGCAYRGVRRR